MNSSEIHIDYLIKRLSKPRKIKQKQIVFRKHRNFGNLNIEDIDVSGSIIDETYLSVNTNNNNFQPSMIIAKFPCLEVELLYITDTLKNIGGTVNIHEQWIGSQPKIYIVYWQNRIETAADMIDFANNISSLWRYL